MRRTPNRTRAKVLRLLVAAAVAVPSVVVLSLSASSIAAPTQAEVDQAQARLQSLNHQLGTANENYNEAAYRLSQTQDQLAQAKAAKDAAAARAERARARLSDRAVTAYTGMGTQLDILLGADDFTQFSDRLEFMGAMAQSDADLAAAADRATQEAEWAAQQYASVLQQQQAQLKTMADERQRFQDLVAEAQSLYQTLSQQRTDFLAAQRAAAAAAALQEQQIQSVPVGGIGGTFAPPPPVNGSGASAAVQAAYSVIGAPYVFSAAGPSAFDCSGLTSWAWAQAGVSLPHSAAAQYGSLPQVPLSEIQPGDIIYYGNFGPHVALYVGGGTIIHATHPGPGGGVHSDSLYGYDTPWGAVRPG